MPLRAHEHLYIGKDRDEAARLAADAFVAALAGAGGRRSVALAGGSTPRTLYTLLSGPPYRESLRGPDIHWFWGDERVVPLDHPDSNYHMAGTTLLQPLLGERSSSQIHPMLIHEQDVQASAAAYEAALLHLLPRNGAGTPVFDLVVLGVGEDGHTASLFPGTDALRETSRFVVANYVPSQQVWRLTLTYPVLLAARTILFFVCGPGKAEIMSRILHHADPALPATPVRRASGRLFWVLDADAARLVSHTESH